MVRDFDYEISVAWMIKGQPYRRKIIVPYSQGSNPDYWKLIVSYVLKVHYKAVDNGCRPRQMIWRVRRV